MWPSIQHKQHQIYATESKEARKDPSFGDCEDCKHKEQYTKSSSHGRNEERIPKSYRVQQDTKSLEDGYEGLPSPKGLQKTEAARKGKGSNYYC